MLLRFCELFLTITYNILVLINQRKKKRPEETKNIESSANLKDVLTELRRLEGVRKKLSKTERVEHEDMKSEMKELNERLKNIETILYEKRTDLLKEKIVNNNSKEKDK